MSSERVIVYFPSAHPDLWIDLQKVPKRFRAERLRLLAAIGLEVTKKSGVLPTAPAPEPTSARAPAPDTTDAGRQVRKSIRDRLKASVQQE